MSATDIAWPSLHAAANSVSLSCELQGRQGGSVLYEIGRRHPPLWSLQRRVHGTEQHHGVPRLPLGQLQTRPRSDPPDHAADCRFRSLKRLILLLNRSAARSWSPWRRATWPSLAQQSRSAYGVSKPFIQLQAPLEVCLGGFIRSHAIRPIRRSRVRVGQSLPGRQRLLALPVLSPAMDPPPRSCRLAMPSAQARPAHALCLQDY